MLKNKKFTLSVCVVLLASIVLILMLCLPKNKYDDKLIIGNDVSSIVDTYGEFEHTLYDIDGTVGQGWYVLKEASNGLFGSEYPTYYIIVFENNIASESYEYQGLYIGG